MTTKTVAIEQLTTAKMAEWAASLNYRDLPHEIVHQAKRFILDTIACGIAGFRQHDVKIALHVLGETAGKGPATVIGLGKRVDVVSATLANALMVRCMDFNDIYWKQDPSHPSDLFPAAVAASERSGSGGKELIVGIVLGHEFEMRFCEAAYPGVEERGWHHATLTAFVSPIVAGRILRLSSSQIQNAIGISGCRHITLGSVSAGDLTMVKNTADPMATQSGMVAALLAEQGYTGPGHLIEGKEGLVHCMGPGWRLEVLTEGLGESWRISQCGMKAFPTEALTHAPISAAIELVSANDVQPEQIVEVRVHTLSRAADILSDPSKYDPRTKETADHSLPFVIALAVVDRKVSPSSFTPEKLSNARIRRQLNKVKLVGNQEIDQVFPRLQRTIVEITTKDGRHLAKQVDYPKGDPRNPITDQELEQKFFALCDGVLSTSAQKRLLDAIWHLDEDLPTKELMSLTKSRTRS